MNFTEIKKQFEHPCYFYRSEFISEYDFKDNYSEYYRDFIIKNIGSVQKALYLSDLIDLSSDLNFFEKSISSQIQDILMRNSASSVVRLSAISYLEMEFLTLKNELILEIFDLLAKKRILLIVKNQLYFTLFEHTKDKKYLDLLLKTLEKTEDWRSIYRTLDATVAEDTMGIDVKKAIISTIYDLHKKKNFGRGVESLLNTDDCISILKY